MRGLNTRKHARQKVAVLTTSRAEYYQLRSVLKSIEHSDILSLCLLVSGTHLSSSFGSTVNDILADGFKPAELLPALVEDGSPLGAALTAGLLMQQLAGALQRQQPDLLLLTGDRYEMLAAGLAAVCLDIPIAHLHGGERTDGAMDDACRHALTKLAALHFVTTEVYRSRVIQLGEPPERVFVIGAPFLDQILAVKLLPKAALVRRLGISLIPPVALVAYHPSTRERSKPGMVCREILQIASHYCGTIICSAPNNDPGHEEIRQAIGEFVQGREGAAYFDNLGSQVFLSVMNKADVMLGNSSSGIHEAVSFGLPVVNVGKRQAGRLRPANVIDAAPMAKAIEAALLRALEPAFQSSLKRIGNPFGDGRAGEKLVSVLEQLCPFGQTIPAKTFHDGPEVQTALELWKRGNQE